MYLKKEGAETNICNRKYIIRVAEIKQIIKDIAVPTKNGKKQNHFRQL